ncbi:thiolase domain-containing protein [Litorilinea aerophila]|uniref:Thiolase domain-containing protein n=1 Tax=Litorilinea aerophila TaxID=1204385 RepID=A0A540VHS8_9CHLR|nr:thiolase domain-containing protein [Litorilinea aerophila]MCC9075959.1 thiolase domain-containing protein [Litorilinea aerophila]OUC09144.1 acetyl-CoA acetyltransferase [Litorilinea aerophila]GIV78683.1 MAG: acetyl-CoA acetyltransferase [Litorilinea sp.]
MRSVSIIGIGQSPVGELWDRSAREIAYTAISAAMADAGIDRADALFLGNMLSGNLLDQEHMATLVADTCGLHGIEAAKVEAACASGAAALRVGAMAVASGFHDVVIVAGVEKMTDTVGKDTTAGLATAADAEYEALHGVSFVALNALIMQRYMYEFDVPLDAFAGFSINAHRNGANNPNAMFREAITLQDYLKAPVVATPISIMDSSPVCDGAAAVVLVPTERVKEFTTGHHWGSVQILASASANDTLAVHDRRDPLYLEAAAISSQKAYRQAGITPQELDLFEVHDAFTIMAALSLEACGFAGRGEGWRLAQEEAIGIDGQIPISTMGGLKSRGHPVGATGIYQIVELVLQLSGRAGANQVKNARLGMAQNIGGSGATIVTHILGS